MKLKNKRTGEIGYPYFQNWKEITCVIVDENAIQIAEYTSLAELNEEWEDVPEEPKVFWFIDPEILIACESTEPLLCDKKVAIETMKQIGNYFDTREQAELAVRKLKAWKRLKDEYDFKFTGWKRDEQFRGDFIITAQDWNTSDDKLLDLLFGGEE